MTDRPILFSAPMVRALLAGRKTQTRRIVKFPGVEKVMDFVKVGTDAAGRSVYEMKDDAGEFVTRPAGKHLVDYHFSPPIAVGDRLWVRETWSVKRFEPCLDHERDWQSLGSPAVRYAADAVEIQHHGDRKTGKGIYHGAVEVKRPSIFMPRWASRLTLLVTEVRIERLHDIYADDAIAEGIEPHFSGWMPYTTAFYQGDGETPANYHPDPRESFRSLWISINGLAAWTSNPWVAVYTFTVTAGNIDQVGR